MQRRFYLDMKLLKRRSSFWAVLCLLIFSCHSVAFSGDVPVDRDFLRLPDQRWIWLEKTGWHETRIILGKGKKSFKNRIWSEAKENDGKHTWAYAFFVRLYPNKFISFDSNKNPLVAVSTYDMGNNVIRYVIIYRVTEDRLEMVREIPGFNAAADHSVFQ
jgi:hypothetical protein